MEFDIQKYAALARIKLTDEEVSKLTKDAEGILDYFKELQKLDTEKVEPVIGGTDLENVFRKDSLAEPTSNDNPLSSGGGLKVPKIFE